jgi:hypothetical protein
MRTAAICPTCPTYTNALCTLYNGSYLSNIDINPLSNLEDIVETIDSKIGTLQPSLGFTPENVTNKSQDIDADTGSTTKYPSVKAVEDYVAAHSGGQSTSYARYIPSTDANNPTLITTQYNVLYTNTVSPSEGYIILPDNPTLGDVYYVLIEPSNFSSIEIAAGSGNRLNKLGSASSLTSIILDDTYFNQLLKIEHTHVASGFQRWTYTVMSNYIAPEKLYKTYSARVSYTGSFTITELQNDFYGVTYSYTNPSTAIVRITASSNIFTLNKAFVMPSFINGGGIIYGTVLLPTFLTNVLEIALVRLENNSTTGTPFFTNQLIELRVYN